MVFVTGKKLNLKNFLYPSQTMKTSIFIKNAVIASILCTGLIACNHTVTIEPPVDTIKDSAKASTVENLDQLMTNIPDPSAISKEMASEGIQINKALLNSPDKASSYTTSFQQAVNMGIYGADMGYLSAYNQLQDVVQYFVQVAKMGNSLGITSTFDQRLIQLIQKDATTNKDTLNALIQTSFDRAQRELYANKKAATGALIFGGGWIEGLYIATNMINGEKNAKNQQLYQRIWDHVYSIRYLQKALADYPNDADCVKMQKLLAPLEAASASLTNAGLSLKDIQNLKTTVTSIRSGLI